MLSQKIKTLNVSIFAMLFVFWVSEAFSITTSEITQQLACTCGCNMVVSACEGSMECTAAKNITDKAAELIKKGQNRDEIIQHFVRTYGERILAAPTRKGFNLAAWILPFLAILLAAAGIYVFLDHCLSSKKEGSYQPTAGNNKGSEEDKKYLDQLEEELKAFDL